MFKFRKETEPTQLQKLIDKHTAELLTENFEDDELARRVSHLSALIKMQEAQTSSRRVDANTVAIIAANLVGIAIIVGYEHAHTITSKAVSFVPKLK